MCFVAVAVVAVVVVLFINNAHILSDSDKIHKIVDDIYSDYSFCLHLLGYIPLPWQRIFLLMHLISIVVVHCVVFRYHAVALFSVFNGTHWIRDDIHFFTLNFYFYFFFIISITISLQTCHALLLIRHHAMLHMQELILIFRYLVVVLLLLLVSFEDSRKSFLIMGPY